MTRPEESTTTPTARRCVLAVALALAAIPHARALDTKVSGRVTFGSVWRTEASDPVLTTSVNAAALGIPGVASGGNADDGNLNWRKGDAASTALKAYLDLSARDGGFAALVRIKAWRDFSLLDDGRPWGNSISGYAPNQPLGDAGAARLSRFSGIALGDAWIEQSVDVGGMRVLGRVGQQSLDWGARSGMPGGLESINAKDLPALHRAGAAPQETRVAMPMLFGRLEPASGIGIEAYYQTKFTPSALDVCGTIWSVSDYMTQGCDRVMTGPPLVSDRARIPLGAYQKRLPTPKPHSAEFGLGVTWKPASLGADLGLYHARYNSRTPLPGLRRSTRNGPAMIAGDPDGQNMAYFTEYPEGIAITAFTFAARRGTTSVYGEVSYRRNQPFMLSPSDVVPPFLNLSVPSLLRADVNATPPGGLFHGYDSYPVAQAQIGVQHEWRPGGVPVSAAIEAVEKHTVSLPDPAVRRYNRADAYGGGPIFGVCTVATGDPGRQCTLRGYASPDAWAYRLRLDARFAAIAPGLDLNASVVFTQDVKGWSGDFLVNEGRKTANLALRFEYRQRYIAELSYMPNWGGDYNVTADRDTLALAVGVRF
jgi:hypothetical protein